MDPALIRACWISHQVMDGNLPNGFLAARHLETSAMIPGVEPTIIGWTEDLTRTLARHNRVVSECPSPSLERRPSSVKDACGGFIRELDFLPHLQISPQIFLNQML